MVEGLKMDLKEISIKSTKDSNNTLEVCDVKEFIKNIKDFISRKDMKGIDEILLKIDQFAGKELI